MQNNISCYGKHMIFRGVDRCPQKRTLCLLGEDCLSASNEHWEDVRYHKYQHVSIGDVFFDQNAEDSERGERAGRQYAMQETQTVDDMPCTNDECPDVVLAGITVSGNTHEVLLRVINEISDLYLTTPHAFDCLMKKIYQDKRQVDVAKEKNITRQGLNKRLLYELGIAQKRNGIQQRRDQELARAKKECSDKLQEIREKDELLKTLSARDWMIYKLIFVDGCSLKNASIQLGIAEKTVWRMSKLLRSKLSKNVQISRGRKKEMQKKLHPLP